MEKDYLSALMMEHVVFDCIEFHREGFQNNNEVEHELEIQIGTDAEKSKHKVSLVLTGRKEREYTFKVGLTGIFRIEHERKPEGIDSDKLIQKNAVAILMPYLRSQVTLLTSQPEMQPEVLPIFNVDQMLKKE